MNDCRTPYMAREDSAKMHLDTIDTERMRQEMIHFLCAQTVAGRAK